ncbi:MAG: type II toxin-antitoxin system HicA family toxin [Spirochaetales bacterium]|nr:type II toxin-antitoxin system HicA family toxin [Spirochaetales bacterium]
MKFLEVKGFTQSRQKGSQLFFRHSDGRTAVVPVHKGEDLGKSLIGKILRDIEVEKEELMEWLGK